MGCISSKVITRSMSFQQEMNLSIQRTTEGIPVLEELFTNSNGSDQFLAFISTAKTISNNLPAGSSNLSPNRHATPTLDPSCTETINTWELIGTLEEREEEKLEMQNADISLLSPPVVEQLDNYKAKLSKSCHWSPENQMSARVPEDESKGGSKAIVCSRSFHTIEEYDAMVGNIWLVREWVTGSGDEHGSAAKVQLQHSKCSSKKSYSAYYNCSNIHVSAQSSLQDKELIRENSWTDKSGKPLTSGPGTKEVLPSLDSYKSMEKLKTFEGLAHEGNISEKGMKRRVIAKGLKSLQIPSTVEFPTVASLREWLHGGGQVYSPGAYVTPTFGSYNLPPRPGKNCSKDSIFDPELVAAFENCMQQLEVEEEIILKQIERDLEEDWTNATAAEEGTPSNT